MANDNLIVYVNPDPNNPNNTNGGLYSLPASVYTNQAYAMGPDISGQALSLLSQGTVVANIPDSGIGLGGWCYLINLPALQPPSVNPGGQAAKGVKAMLTPSQVLVAVQALLKHTQPSVPGTKDREIADSVEALVNKFSKPGK